jgi:hypothetical protein
VPSPDRQGQWIVALIAPGTLATFPTGSCIEMILLGHDIFNFVTGQQRSTAHSLKNTALADSLYCVIEALLVWAKAD